MKKTGQVFRNYLFWVTYGDSQIDFLAGSREFYGGGTNMNMAGDYLPLRLSFSAGFSCKARFICKDKKERENEYMYALEKTHRDQLIITW